MEYIQKTSRTGNGYFLPAQTVYYVLWAWSEGDLLTGEATRLLELDDEYTLFDAAIDNDVPRPDWMILNVGLYLSPWDKPADAITAFRAGLVPAIEDITPEKVRYAEVEKKAILGSMHRRRRTVDPARAFAEGLIDRDEALARSDLTLPELIAVLSNEELPIPGEGELVFYIADDDTDFAEAVFRTARYDDRGWHSGRSPNIDDPVTVFDLLSAWSSGIRTGVEVCRRLDITPDELKASASFANIQVPISRGVAPITYRKPEPPVSEPTPKPERRPTATPRRSSGPDGGGFKP